MSDLSDDVRARLTRLLDEAAVAARARDEEALVDAIDAVVGVTADDVPEGDLRAQLRHGCRRVDRLAEDEPLVAAAYCEAMRRRVEG